MKIPLTILLVVALFLGGFILLAPEPPADMKAARSDLPWQISVLPDGTSKVFDLHLGWVNLQSAIDKFGPYEGMAVFQGNTGKQSLEAYFGNVMFGPLKAKVVVSLVISEDAIDALQAGATNRESSPSGDWKYLLSHSVAEQQLGRSIRSISYVPGSRSLDAEFFRERFGVPAAWLRESEQAVSWFYPELGFSVLIDADKKEVLEYVAPKDFVMPDGVTMVVNVADLPGS